MNKPFVIIAAAGAAAWLLMNQYSGSDTESTDYSDSTDSGDSGEGGGQTAGDMDSNFISDAADSVIGMITNWPSGSGPYQDTIAQAAAQYGVPVEILAWLLWKESRYNPAIIDGTKRSPVGALGIAQFMPATAQQELGSVAAALDPSIAIPGAARYLAKLYSIVGTWSGALAAYNWGIGNVQRKGLSRAPAETRDYYTSILAKANNGGGVYA